MASQKALEFSFTNSVITKVLKDSGVPENTSVSKDARSALGKAASIFVLYLTTKANDLAQEDKRKTISPLDIVEATKNIGFEEFTDDLGLTYMECKKQNEESKRKRAEKQRLKSQSQSLLANNSNRGDNNDSSQNDRSSPEVMEVDDD